MTGFSVPAVVALAITLAGCGAVPLQPTTTVTVANTNTGTGDEPADKVLFAELLDYPDLNSLDRELLIEKAHSVCSMLDREGGGTDAKGVVLGRLMAAGIDMDNSIGFMAAAVKAYCPQHLADVGVDSGAR
jgi:hypothetical protein